jgi:sarcosine oxidase subunit gamma
MLESVHHESPLADHKLSLASAKEGRTTEVTLSESPFLGHINLRGDPASAEFLNATEQVMGCKLPLEANTFIDGNKFRVCWLGPDEWLVICAQQRESESAEELRGALAGQFAAVTAIGSGQTILVLRGPRGREVLAKGCALDLHARVFRPGRCAQSHIARASAMILQIDEASAFEIVVRRSFASYLWLWLTDAAAEFGVAVVEPTQWALKKVSE